LVQTGEQSSRGSDAGLPDKSASNLVQCFFAPFALDFRIEGQKVNTVWT
jgi:hypothetical protein